MADRNVNAGHLYRVAPSAFRAHRGDGMDAEQVRAYVAAKWPEALQSPLAQKVAELVAADSADRVATELRGTIAAALKHAEACIRARACISGGGGWTVETLGHNIETEFGLALDADDCDDIAREALKGASPTWHEAQINALRAACEEALEFVQDQEDVVDGSYGEQRPNAAMTVAATLRNALGCAAAREDMRDLGEVS